MKFGCVIPCVILMLCGACDRNPLAEITPAQDSVPAIAEPLVSCITGASIDDLLGLLPDRNPDYDQMETLVADLRGLQWDGGEPSASTEMQPLLLGDFELDISSGLGKYIKRFSAMYAEGTLTEVEYVQSLTAIDSLLSGVLASHERIAHEDVPTFQSPLTHAALMRGAISHELRSSELGENAPRSEVQARQLVEVAQTQNYEQLSQFP